MQKFKQRKSKHKAHYIIDDIHVDAYSKTNSTKENSNIFDESLPTIMYLNGGPGALEFPNLTKYIDSRNNNFLMMYYFGSHSTDTLFKLKSEGIENILNRHSLQNFVEDMHKVITYFKINRLILIGTCFGTLISIKYASKYPTIINKIILTEPYTNMINDDKQYFILTTLKGRFSKDEIAIKLYNKLKKSINIENEFYTLETFVERILINVKNEIEENKILIPENSPVTKAYLEYILYISSTNRNFIVDVLERFEFIRYAIYELHWAKHKYFLSKRNNYSLEDDIKNIIEKQITIKLIYNISSTFFDNSSLDVWKQNIGSDNIIYFSSISPGLYAKDAKESVLTILNSER